MQLLIIYHFVLFITSLLGRSSISRFNLYHRDDGKDCLYYNAIDDVVTHVSGLPIAPQIIPYCIESIECTEANESIEKSVSWTFVELKEKQVSSEDLLSWSAPIDLAERYEIFLNNPNVSYSPLQTIFHNCSEAWFGFQCEYTFDEKYRTFSELVLDFFAGKSDYRPDSKWTNGTCYTYLPCDRGASPLCLDWREICNGRRDCLNGDIDEPKYCVEFEANECTDNEYRCRNGQCIPREFFGDGDPDCSDGTDDMIDYDSYCAYDPSSRCEDHTCPRRSEFACGDGQCIDRYLFDFSKDLPLSLKNFTEWDDLCEQSRLCVSKHRLLDGNKDCWDNSDEDFNGTCLLNHTDRFQCPSDPNRCIFPVLVNDGVPNCPAGEDEQVTIGKREYQQQALFPMLCDWYIDMRPRIIDEREQTDETDCGWYFPCNTQYTQCNGEWDCPNGLDEADCHSSQCSPYHHPGIHEPIHRRLIDDTEEQRTCATRIYNREKLNHIDMDRLNIPMSMCGQGTNFSVAFAMLIETLDGIKNDSTCNSLRQTIIFLTDGEPQIYPTSELERLSTDYKSMITDFWIMGLGNYNKKVLQQINEKMQGKLTDIEKPEDLIEAYAEIADSCDINLS
ncbi:unnamed protein product [Rotaria sordida]|uniref:VWFA domain-containing protein n=1 Tax=Rotaria sordida TaxID=392033 RepID=A0A819J2Q0_9BILA|nr:unnamed protein product [Rotaria sordida]